MAALPETLPAHSVLAASSASEHGAANAISSRLTGAKRYEQLDAHIGQGTYGKVEKARDLMTGE